MGQTRDSRGTLELSFAQTRGAFCAGFLARGELLRVQIPPRQKSKNGTF